MIPNLTLTPSEQTPGWSPRPETAGPESITVRLRQQLNPLRSSCGSR